MAIRIRDITQESVQLAFNRFSKDHKPKTCKNVHGLISAVLSVERPDLKLKTTLPQKEKRGIYVPDDQEVRSLYLLVKGTEMEIPFLLAVECGLRASEIAALKTDNISDEWVYIKEASVIDKNNKPVSKPPKSVSGYRTVPICKEFSDYLRAYAVNGRVCAKNSHAISDAWFGIKLKHNLNKDLVFHALRHHFASKCLLLGMPQKYIAELMGHSDTKMIEQVYQHTFPSAMEKFANQLRNQERSFIMYDTKYDTKI
ncbi:MAG: site-specific integrase [Bacteroides sp.]|nr:site-specific integrase [Eubacterium sp.]MCM1463737.1 site-specific integrase [Bacteroides sp.]